MKYDVKERLKQKLQEPGTKEVTNNSLEVCRCVGTDPEHAGSRDSVDSNRGSPNGLVCMQGLNNFSEKKSSEKHPIIIIFM